MSTWAQLQARAALLASFGAWTDTAVAPDWPTLTNQAWQEFSWIAELLILSETINTVNAQVSYTTTNVYKTILDLSWNALPVRRSSEAQERFINPAWLNTPAATQPVRWVLSSDVGATVSLIPPPTAVGPLFVRGIVQGPLMVLSTDQPGQVSGAGIAIPAYFHEAIPLRAAVLWGELYAQGDEFMRLNAYMRQYMAYANDARTGLTTALDMRRAAVTSGDLFSPQQGQ